MKPPEDPNILFAFLDDRQARFAGQVTTPPGSHWEMGIDWWRAIRRASYFILNGRWPTPEEEEVWRPSQGLGDKVLGYPVEILTGLPEGEPRLKPDFDFAAYAPYKLQFHSERMAQKVSSTWNLICLSHDPAIRLDGYDFADWHSVERATREHEALASHQTCDIIAGRYSGGLVELGCFGAIKGNGLSPQCSGYHNGVIWYKADVLRLVHAVYQQRSKAISGSASAPAQTIVGGGGGLGLGGGGGPSAGQGNVNYGTPGWGSAYGVGGGAGGGGGAGSLGTGSTIPERLIVPFRDRCWPPQRLRRILLEMGVEDD